MKSFSWMILTMAFAQYALSTNRIFMKCPRCGSEQFQKNGHRGDKQNYRCKNCGRQYVEAYVAKGYSEDAKQICIRMYREGLKLREIGRLTGISHGTVYNWLKQAELLSGTAEPPEDEI